MVVVGGGISNDGLRAHCNPTLPLLITQLRPSSKECVNTFIRGKDVASFLSRHVLLHAACSCCHWRGSHATRKWVWWHEQSHSSELWRMGSWERRLRENPMCIGICAGFCFSTVTRNKFTWKATKDVPSIHWLGSRISFYFPTLEVSKVQALKVLCSTWGEKE